MLLCTIFFQLNSVYTVVVWVLAPMGTHSVDGVSKSLKVWFSCQREN